MNSKAKLISLSLLLSLFLFSVIPASAIPATPHDYNRPDIVVQMSAAALTRENYISDLDIDSMITSDNKFVSELPLTMRDMVLDLDESSFGKPTDMTATTPASRDYGVGYWVPNTTLELLSASGITTTKGFEPVSAGGNQANFGFTFVNDEDATVEHGATAAVEDGDTAIAIDADTYVYICFQADAASYNETEVQYLSVFIIVEDANGDLWDLMISTTAVSGTDGWSDLAAHTEPYYDANFSQGIAGGAEYINYAASADVWYGWTFNIEDVLDLRDADFGSNVAAIRGWGASVRTTKSDAETAYIHVRQILLGRYENLNLLNNLSDSETTDTGTDIQDFLNVSTPATSLALDLEGDRWEIKMGNAFHIPIERIYFTTVEVAFTPTTQIVGALDQAALTATIAYTIDLLFGSEEPFYGKAGTYYINMTNLDPLHEVLQLTIDGTDCLEADGDIDSTGCSAIIDEDSTTLSQVDDFYTATTDEPIRWTPATSITATNLFQWSVKFKILAADIPGLTGGAGPIIVPPVNPLVVIGGGIAAIFTGVGLLIRKLMGRRN